MIICLYIHKLPPNGYIPTVTGLLNCLKRHIVEFQTSCGNVLSSGSLFCLYLALFLTLRMHTQQISVSFNASPSKLKHVSLLRFTITIKKTLHSGERVCLMRFVLCQHLRTNMRLQKHRGYMIHVSGESTAMQMQTVGRYNIMSRVDLRNSTEYL